MKLKIKKLHPDAQIPKYATKGAACFDLHALIDPEDDGGKGIPMHWADSTCIFRTGLSFEIPEGFVMMIYSRSGHGFKHGARLSNCVGVIDSDYRGEVQVKLHKDIVQADSLVVKNGDRIAQAMIIPATQVEFDEFAELTSTDRGTGGFGSTGS